MQSVSRLLCVLATCVVPTLCAAGETVGAFGDLQQLQIRGTRAFSPAQIKDALAPNIDMQLASESDAPLSDYLATLERLIRSGYRQAGYADVTVKVQTEPKTFAIIVDIQEGVRYMAGEVRVQGGKTVPTEALSEYLTRPHPPRDATEQSWTTCDGKTIVQWVDKDLSLVEPAAPFWEVGKPAKFLTEPESESKLHDHVYEAFADLGYHRPEFSVKVVADPASRKGHLVVDIAEEGKRTTLDKVMILGNEVNTREEILKYVDFKPGVAATRDEVSRLQNKLWHSGRFLKSRVTAIPATQRDPSVLWIDLLELHGVPSLSKPLSRDAEMLLKCRDWMADSAHWNSDLVFSANINHFAVTAVTSHTDGTHLHVQVPATPMRKAAEYAVVCSPEETGLYCLSLGRKHSVRPFDGQVQANIVMRLNEEANTLTEKRSLLALSFGVHVGRPKTESQIKLSIALEPSYFLDMAYRPDTKCTIQDKVMAVSRAGDDIRFDLATGRLIEWLSFVTDEDAVENTSSSKSRKASDSQSTGKRTEFARFSFVSGEFRRRLEAVRAATGKSNNSYDAKRPASSLLEFACDNGFFWEPIYDSRAPHAIRVLRQLCEHGACESLDRCILNNEELDDDFSVPVVGSASEKISGTAKLVACFVSAIAHKLFCRESWPHDISRLVLLSACDREDVVEKQLKRIRESKQDGPLCLLTGHTVFEYLDPAIDRELVLDGIHHLSIEDYRKDYAAILDPRYPVGQWLRRVAADLCNLDDRDTESLCELLSEPYATVFRQWVNDARKNPKASIDESIANLLDAVWKAGMRESIENAFHAASQASSAQNRRSN